MRKHKIYLDTSVINFLFADDAPEKMDITKEYFENFIKLNVYNHFISEIVINEIERTQDNDHRNRLLKIIKDYNIETIIVEPEEEIITLANQYLDENIIPQKKIEDALHVAVATFNEIDFLLSWNYKHLANVNKEKQFEIVNLKNGYLKSPRLCTPMELFNE
jgi:predicted nucleic acid-binding protein